MTKDNRKLADIKALGISCVLGSLAGVVLTIFLSELPSPPYYSGSGITKATFDLIEEEMTQEDVEKILGCPPGNYTYGQAGMPQIAGRNGIIREVEKGVMWIGNEGSILVRFSEDGKLIRKYFYKTYIPPTWFDWIKHWFRI